MNKTAIDMTGQRFGRLTILGPAERPQGVTNRCQYWQALCDCGKLVVVMGAHVRSGNTSSCGCLRTLYYQCQKHGIKYDKERHHGQR